MTDEFRHRTRVEVRFRDIDAFGHVNNAVTASYVEHARVTYLQDVLGLHPVGRMPLILAMLKIDYTAPIFLGDPVEIASRVDWIGTSSLAMSHHVSDPASSRDLARASSVLVTYDYAKDRPMAVPTDWRSALATHEGRSLERPAEAVGSR